MENDKILAEESAAASAEIGRFKEHFETEMRRFRVGRSETLDGIAAVIKDKMAAGSAPPAEISS